MAGRTDSMPDPARTAGSEGPGRIPVLEFGVSGPSVCFLHANGYPPACYLPLIERLTTDHRVLAMLLRPLWPGSKPDAISDWRPLSADLRQLLGTQHTGPVIGMGHSLGAVVTLRAALQEPQLFSALVLIDPVLLPPLRIFQLRVVRALGLSNRLHNHTEAALRRRRHFDSLDQLFAGYRRREIFRRFGDRELQALVAGITRPSADSGYDLLYSPEWEARIYQTGVWNDLDIWDALPALKVPTLIIRGAQTDTFVEKTATYVRQRYPAIEILTVPEATHLVPLERPTEVVQATEDFLARLRTA